METNEKQLGIVVEAYDYDYLRRVLVVRSQEVAKNHTFFFIPRLPAVDFGDIIQMNFADDAFYIRRGNSRLTYRIRPLVFPGTLLLELITERLNQ